MQKKHNDLLNILNDTSTRLFNCNINESTEKQLYKTVCTVLRELLAKKRKDFRKDVSQKERKQVYYMSMEFLVGTSLRNNLYNIGLEKQFKEVLAEIEDAATASESTDFTVIKEDGEWKIKG